MTLDRALQIAIVALREGDTAGYRRHEAVSAAVALENLRSTLHTGRPLSGRRDERARWRAAAPIDTGE